MYCILVAYGGTSILDIHDSCRFVLVKRFCGLENTDIKCSDVARGYDFIKGNLRNF